MRLDLTEARVQVSAFYLNYFIISGELSELYGAG